MNSEVPQAANENTKPKYRVSDIEALGMIFLALIGDAIGLIPIIGFVGTILCGGGVIMWLYFKGVKPLDFKSTKKAVGKVLNLFGNGVAEGVTAAVFPSLLIYTGVALVTAFLEDRTGVSVPITPTKKPTSVRQLTQRRVSTHSKNDNVTQSKKVA